jgi:hypothetical protein
MGTLGTMAQPSLDKGWRLDDFREGHLVIYAHLFRPVNCQQVYSPASLPAKLLS